MNWRQLLLGDSLFREKEPLDRFYFEYLRGHDSSIWASDDGPTDDDIGRMLRFLNQWRTHYPSGPEAQLSFKAAYRQIRHLLLPMSDVHFLDVDFDLKLDGHLTFKQAIEQTFEVLASHGQRYESTGTSKILHMLRPNLFVMWDDAICLGYAVRKTAEDYANRFLPLMQQELREAVGSYIAENEAGPETAAAKLECLGDSRPLTKLVDEYNYCKYTLRLPELWNLQRLDAVTHDP